MKQLIFIFCVLFSLHADSQEYKRNNMWLFSTSGAPLKYDFNTDTFKIVNNQLISTPYPVFSFGGSNISDTNGNLLFGCNGFMIYNKEGFGIGGFDIINNALGNKLYDYYGGDGFWNQMSIILPKKNNQYYVFTTGMSDAAYDDWKGTKTDFKFDVLSYHVVDMDANAGAGKVVSKNNILMKDARLSHNRMTAVRHANGRDWWLIKPHQWKQTFYTYLVTPDSITGPFEQNVPNDLSNFDFFTNGMAIGEGVWGIQGQLAISPDGNWVANTEAAYKGMFIYHFDRCSGGLTNYHFYQQATFDTTSFDWSVATCFSPDSKLVYLITGSNIWQCELSDTSLNSVMHISGPDTLLDYFPEYNLSYLAPNGQLFIGAWHGVRNTMPFIENPDIRGIGCNFRGRGNDAFSQPFTNLLVPPNLPFYGLGKIEGSPCDTIKPYVEPPPPPPPPQPTTLLNILIPNAFSPNGDGKNDTWHILNIAQLQLAGITLQAVGVYNRWGNEVFKSSDINFSWDGASLSSDTYYYYIRYRTLAGTSQVQKGSVNLVR